jgi:hypothetical protein
VFSARLAAARARQGDPVAPPSVGGPVAAAPAGPDVELVAPGSEPQARPVARHRRTAPAQRHVARTERTHRHRSRAHPAVIGSRGLVVGLMLVGLGLAAAWLALVL